MTERHAKTYTTTLEGPAQARFGTEIRYPKDVRASQWPAGVIRAFLENCCIVRAGKLQRMSANVSKCQQTSASVSNCCRQKSANVSIPVEFCTWKILSHQQLSANVSNYQQMSANVSNCQQMSAYVSKCQQMLASVSKMIMTPAYPIMHQPHMKRTWFSPPASAYMSFSHD